MNIQTVAENLRNTIAGKENRLETIKHLFSKYSEVNLPPLCGTIKQLLDEELVLRGVIKELKRILQDVEQCRPEWNVHTCPYTETCHRID